MATTKEEQTDKGIKDRVLARAQVCMDEKVLNEPLATAKQKKQKLHEWEVAGAPRIWVRDHSFTLKESGEKLVADYDIGYGYMRMLILKGKDDTLVEGAWTSYNGNQIKLRDFICQYEGGDEDRLVVYRVYK